MMVMMMVMMMNSEDKKIKMPKIMTEGFLGKKILKSQVGEKLFRVAAEEVSFFYPFTLLPPR